MAGGVVRECRGRGCPACAEVVLGADGTKDQSRQSNPPSQKTDAPSIGSDNHPFNGLVSVALDLARVRDGVLQRASACARNATLRGGCHPCPNAPLKPSMERSPQWNKVNFLERVCSCRGGSGEECLHVMERWCDLSGNANAESRVPGPRTSLQAGLAPANHEL